jgi:hypothetical protein
MAQRLDFAQLADTVRLPRTAVPLAVSIGRLLYSYDDSDRAPVARRFVECRPGEPIPAGARFVGSYTAHGTLGSATPCAVYEIVDDLPTDLPVEMHGHYRELVGAGFTLRGDKAWLAPADVEPGRLTYEQVVAVASLQEHGYGPVVGA